jgi:hypothetical protein
MNVYAVLLLESASVVLFVFLSLRFTREVFFGTTL